MPKEPQQPALHSPPAGESLLARLLVTQPRVYRGWSLGRELANFL